MVNYLHIRHILIYKTQLLTFRHILIFLNLRINFTLLKIFEWRFWFVCDPISFEKLGSIEPCKDNRFFFLLMTNHLGCVCEFRGEERVLHGGEREKK